MDFSEIILRLGLATLIGGAIGLNRDLHGKPTGLRTLGVVGLGAALIVMTAAGGSAGPIDWNSVSRVVQGVITGVGFLGAGVIIHNAEGRQVHGLTTAACIWLTACLGMVCGVGAWRLVGVGVVLVFLLLIFGGRLEHALHRRWGKHPDE